MSIIEESFKLSDSDFCLKFNELCQDTKGTQEEILLDIIRRNEECEIGKKYGFSEIKSVEEFRKKVPLTEWTEYEPLSEGAQKGLSDQSFCGKPELFIVTSGTTGNAKLLPESKMGSMAKAATSRLRKIQLIQKTPEIFSGSILPLSNSASIGTTECGIPFGSASGITLMNTPQEVRDLTAYPLEILKIEDQDALDYALMRFALEHNVTAIIGNNAGRMEKLIKFIRENSDTIIEDIENGTLNDNIPVKNEIRSDISSWLKPNPERAAELRNILKEKEILSPVDYWPNLIVFSCWLSGSVGRYLKAVKDDLPQGVKFMDCGYGASEGKFNIPSTEGEPAGVLSITAGFFEFEPVEGDKELLLAHELKDGASYKLILTTYSGLYRYDMHDVVKVKGFTGTAPNIFFESKTKDIGNICGEKLSARSIISAVENVSKTAGCDVKHFSAVTDMDNFRYDFCIEPEEGASYPEKEFISMLDDELKKNAIVFRVMREQEMLRSPRLLVMKSGWQKALYDEKVKTGVSIAQLKLPLIYSEVPLSNYIIDSFEYE